MRPVTADISGGSPRRPRCRPRRGSAYILALIGSFTVTVLGLATYLGVRLESRIAEQTGDAHQAALLARTGLDMALYWMDHDPSWRTKGAASTWDTPTPLAGGTYRVSLVDPVDDDLTNASDTAVEIEASGEFGAAVRRLRIRVEFDRPGMDCLRSSVHANNEVILKGVTATTDHWITANNKVTADQESGHVSEVYADVAASSEVRTSGGSRYHGITTTDGAWPLQTPNTSDVFSYYLTQGTWIDIQDIPLWGANLLENPGAEGPPPDPPTSGWLPAGGCTLEADGTKTHAGDYALKAVNRADPAAGPGQSVVGKVISGLLYDVSVRAGTAALNDDGRIVLTVTSTGGGVQQFASPWKGVEKDKFVELSGQLAPTWSGQLLSAVWRVETRNTTDDLRIDEAVLSEATPYGFIRTLHRQLLSPAHNPYGSGTTNPEGIYVIDLQGQILSLQRMRISGTLVLLNGPTYIWAVVHWAPAVSNYPALLTNDDVNFWLANEGDTELDEQMSGINYNPPGTPYAGVADLDHDDRFPALMRGLVYSAQSISLAYHPVLEGVVVADGNIVSKATDLGGRSYFDVTYLSRFHRDPPPGFELDPVMRVVPGSLRRVVD